MKNSEYPKKEYGQQIGIDLIIRRNRGGKNEIDQSEIGRSAYPVTSELLESRTDPVIMEIRHNTAITNEALSAILKEQRKYHSKIKKILNRQFGNPKKDKKKNRKKRKKLAKKIARKLMSEDPIQPILSAKHFSFMNDSQM